MKVVGKKVSTNLYFRGREIDDHVTEARLIVSKLIYRLMEQVVTGVILVLLDDVVLVFILRSVVLRREIIWYQMRPAIVLSDRAAGEPCPAVEMPMAH